MLWNFIQEERRASCERMAGDVSTRSLLRLDRSQRKLNRAVPQSGPATELRSHGFPPPSLGDQIRLEYILDTGVTFDRRTAAVLRSFVASCQRAGIDPSAWFKDVLRRIATHPINRIVELLPHC